MVSPNSCSQFKHLGGAASSDDELDYAVIEQINSSRDKKPPYWNPFTDKLIETQENSLNDATDIQFQTEDMRAKTAYAAAPAEANFNPRSRSLIQSQLNKRRLRINQESRGDGSTSNLNQTAKSSMFLRSSVRDRSDLNSDKDTSEPFMDIKDHSLREPHIDKYGSALSRK